MKYNRFDMVTCSKGKKYFLPQSMKIKFEALSKEIAEASCPKEKAEVQRVKEALFKDFKFPEDDEVLRGTSLQPA
jgi:hypothetical protein